MKRATCHSIQEPNMLGCKICSQKHLLVSEFFSRAVEEATWLLHLRSEFIRVRRLLCWDLGEVLYGCALLCVSSLLQLLASVNSTAWSLRLVLCLKQGRRCLCVTAVVGMLLGQTQKHTGKNMFCTIRVVAQGKRETLKNVSLLTGRQFRKYTYFFMLLSYREANEMQRF